MRGFLQERAIENVTGLISELMDASGVSRSDLAARLGVSAGWVTQLLDGERNKTIRTVADVCAVLGHRIDFSASPIASQSAEAISRVSLRSNVIGGLANSLDTSGFAINAKVEANQPVILLFAEAA